MKKKDTSWGKVSKWYDSVVEDGGGSFQSDLILPNLLRLMKIKAGEKVLDIACGQGFFTRQFESAGATAFGADVSAEMIQIAREKSSRPDSYAVAPADSLAFAKDAEFDKATIILAMQNIENLQGVMSEASRVLKKTGKLYIVLNHPAFRIPKKSSWGFDEKKKVQYRIVEQYLSDSMIKIKMHPGKEQSEYTVSFHRPLQEYFKIFKKAGFYVSLLEEWSSDKTSQDGPRKKAEDRARKEIPLFMFLELNKINE